MQNQAAMGYVGASEYSQDQPTAYPRAQNVSYMPTAVPVMLGAPAAQPVLRNLEVVVPTGAYGGSVLQVIDPLTRNALQVTVPSGLQPGMRFQIQVPSNIGGAYQAPQQQPMVSVHQTKENDDCGAFMMGMCFCCTICCLAGN